MRDYELALTEDRLNDNLRELKGLTIGISRAIDRQNGKRGGSPKRELRPADTLVRNAVAELLRPMRPTANGGVIYEKTAAEMARSLYPSDEALQNFITRAAVSPASTTTTDYAAELVATATIDFLTGGEAPSGFAALARQTLQVPLQGSAKVPSRVYPISLTGAWIGEGAPKPVFTVPLSSTTLSPSKLVSITAWSDEIATWSVPSIEALIRDAVARDIAGLLDSTAFDANAATATRPAGLLRASATSVTASTATPLTEAMIADLAGLAAAVTTGAPDARVVFIVSAKQGVRFRMQAADFGDVIYSSYMPNGSVGAVDANSIATMVGDIVFTASNSATVHMNDAPTAIGTPGSPNVVAAPTMSPVPGRLDRPALGTARLVDEKAIRRLGDRQLRKRGEGRIRHERAKSMVSRRLGQSGRARDESCGCAEGRHNRCRRPQVDRSRRWHRTMEHRQPGACHVPHRATEDAQRTRGVRARPRPPLRRGTECAQEGSGSAAQGAGRAAQVDAAACRCRQERGMKRLSTMVAVLLRTDGSGWLIDIDEDGKPATTSGSAAEIRAIVEAIMANCYAPPGDEKFTWLQ